MSVPELMAKYQILSRRVASLPAELDTWIEWAAADNTLQKNFSQIQALDHFMRALCRLNEDGFNGLDPSGNIDAFLDSALQLSANVIKAHTIWDFFRDRLELRFVPQFQQPLLVADLVSYDCYTTVMDRAKALRIIPERGFREYPLTGLFAEFSPATWPRGRRPPALWNRNLPVPVIDVPWDHLINPWELLTIAHEVGHDVDEDLGKLTVALQPAITDRMNEVKTPADRFVRWQQWTSEILADLAGILLTGPAFVRMLTSLLTLPRHCVRHISSTDAHPPHYLRVFIDTALVRRLRLAQSAAAIDMGWKAIYGEPDNEFSSYLRDVEPVISAILDTPIDALQDQDGQRHSLSELISFTPADQALIEEAAAKLGTEASLGKLHIRHVVSASQLAFEQIAKTGDAARLERLAQSTQQAIVELTPPGQLPAGLASHRVRKRLEDLAHALLGRPLVDFGIYLSTDMGGR